jgi:RNA polymerase sigma factor (sigma-70 family)
MTINPIRKVLDRIRGTLLMQEEKEQSDGQLLERFVVGGDKLALETLVRRHAPMVLGVCRRLLRNTHDADDAFQATFLVLVRRTASIRSPELLANWLYRVARKTACKARQIAVKRGVHVTQPVVMPEPPTKPHDDVFGPEELALLHMEVERLPEKYRLAIVLCEMEGKSHRDVAQQLHVKEGTVGSRLARGHALLAKRLARRGVTVSATSVAAVLTEQAASGTVPAALLDNTIQATTLLAVGETVTAGLLSPKVSPLTEGVLRAITGAKQKAASVLLILAALVMGGIVTYHTLAGQSSKLVQPPKDSTEDGPLGMKFVRLPKGTFYMGWDGRNKGKKTEIKEDFEIAIHTVTQGQWQEVMGKNPSSFSRDGSHKDVVKDIKDEDLKQFPVETVSYWGRAGVHQEAERKREGTWLSVPLAE